LGLLLYTVIKRPVIGRALFEIDEYLIGVDSIGFPGKKFLRIMWCEGLIAAMNGLVFGRAA
jgi:hypothetical protein